MNRLLVALLGASVTLSCSSAARPTTRLEVRGARDDAFVTIDEVYVGRFVMVARRGVALPPGTHRISVERPGYFPFDAILEIKAGEPIRVLQVELRPLPR